MALPSQVAEQIGRRQAQTPGWSGRLLMFTGTLLILNVVAYFGLTFGYLRYLNGQIQSVDRQIKSQSHQIPQEERGNIVTFFSQLSNLRLILDKHVNVSSFFSFLEAAAHRNIYYTHLTINSDKREASLSGVAKSVRDITEQVKIFSRRPEIEKVSLGSIARGGGGWQFDITLCLAAEFLASGGMNGRALPTTSTSTATSTSTSTPTSTPRQ